ncbi:MAG: rhodanese-like domain-containing protein [Actinomycetes bacterium]
MRSITVHDLKAVLDSPEAASGPPVVLDVREPYEYADGHVPGAELVPLGTVPLRLGELPADQPVYLLCAVGGRSAQAAGFLAARGVDAVNVDGGTHEWVASGYPVAR